MVYLGFLQYQVKQLYKKSCSKSRVMATFISISGSTICTLCLAMRRCPLGMNLMDKDAVGSLQDWHCSSPQAAVLGKPGVKFVLTVGLFENRQHLPVVDMKILFAITIKAPVA